MVPQAGQLRSQFLKIIDFSVIGDNELTVLSHHRLVSCRGKIDDGEAAMPEPNKAVGEETLAVRASMRNGRGHFSKRHGRDGFTVQIEYADYATHN